MLKRLLPAAALSIGALLLPAQPALAGSSDAASTSTYLHANYALLRVAQSNIRSSEVAYESVLHRVSSECPRAGQGSPQNSQSTQMSNEVIGAMVLSAAGPDLAAIRSYLRAVAGLHWHNAQIEHSVSAYKTMLATISKLAVPDLCTEVRGWATSGFQSLPASTVTFVKAFLPNWVALGLVPSGLSSLEDGQDRSLAQRSHAIEVQITDVEARAVETWGSIMNELVLEP